MRKFSVRLDDDVANELDYLSALFQKSRNEIINLLVRNEFNKYEKDPKIALAIEQMNILKETLSEMDAKLKSFEE